MPRFLILGEFSLTPAGAFWPVVAPVAVGLVAVYLLLPRGRATHPLWGAALGAVALLLAGWSVVRVGAATPETILFYAFSAFAIVGGALLVTQRNPARAALSFALVVLSTCGLFLLQAAPFLMAATTIIYAGAIIVTFLFVLMLAQQAGLSDADQRSREPFLATLAGFVLLVALLYVLNVTYVTPSAYDGVLRQTAQAARTFDELQAEVDPERGRPADVAALLKSATDAAKEASEALAAFSNSSIQRRAADNVLYDALIDAQQPLAEQQRTLNEQQARLAKSQPVDLKALKNALVEARDALAGIQGAQATRGGLRPPDLASQSEFSGPASSHRYEEIRRDANGQPLLPAENVAYLGRSLFTDFLLPVELGGTLLLVATIGAIAIATRRAERTV